MDLITTIHLFEEKKKNVPNFSRKCVALSCRYSLNEV